MDGATLLVILLLLFIIGKGLIPNPFDTSSNVNSPSTTGPFNLLQQGPGPQNIPAISSQNQQAGPVAKPAPWQVACTPSPSLPMNPVAAVASIPGTTPSAPQRVTFTTGSTSGGSGYVRL